MSCSLLGLTTPFPSNSKNYPNFTATTRTRFKTRIHTRNHYQHSLLRRCFTHFGFFREAEACISRNPGRKRCRFAPMATTSMELPLLPFGLSEVLVPSESKTLHLYEARYLALLEESLTKKSKLFVHFLLDPIMINDSSAEPSFAAKYGCLVLIENVEKLDVGALVSIRGVGRIKIVKFVQADPYLKGVVIPEQDSVPDSLSSLSPKVTEIKEALHSLNSLEIKLKAPKEALLQTYTANSLAWAEKAPSVDCDEAFIPSLYERVSFTGFQPVSGSTESELLRLQSKKLRAMELKDTLKRLDESLELNKENISVVAAKLAIQSLEIQ